MRGSYARFIDFSTQNVVWSGNVNKPDPNTNVVWSGNVNKPDPKHKNVVWSGNVSKPDRSQLVPPVERGEMNVKHIFFIYTHPPRTTRVR